MPTGRKKQTVVCEIDGTQDYKVLGSSPDWVQFEGYLVKATPELEAVWREDRELWGLVVKSREKPNGDELQTFRTTGKNFFARDPNTGENHEIESILVLPGGDLLIYWKTFPRHLADVDQEDEEDREELKNRIAQLERILKEKDEELNKLNVLMGRAASKPPAAPGLRAASEPPAAPGLHGAPGLQAASEPPAAPGLHGAPGLRAASEPPAAPGLHGAPGLQAASDPPAAPGLQRAPGLRAASEPPAAPGLHGAPGLQAAADNQAQEDEEEAMEF